MNKPRGIVCTLSDELGRDTILDLLPPQYHSIGLHHVGRLDKESEGLLVLTNDGQLSNQLTHPRHKVEKEYVATLDKPFDFSLKPKLLNGVVTPEGKAHAERVWGEGRKVSVVLTQGMKRQVRHMFAAVGYEVTRLQRVRIGELKAPGLKPGAFSTLRDRQIEKMLERKP
ncbi:MAG: pseudouridine synthase [Verrucomicrobiota bacterium]